MIKKNKDKSGENIWWKIKGWTVEVPNLQSFACFLGFGSDIDPVLVSVLFKVNFERLMAPSVVAIGWSCSR